METFACLPQVISLAQLTSMMGMALFMKLMKGAEDTARHVEDAHVATDWFTANSVPTWP